MSQGCSEEWRVSISQALWFQQTKGCVEVQSMTIQHNCLSESHRRSQQRRQKGSCFHPCHPRAKPPPSYIHAGRYWWELPVFVCSCVVPLYSQWRGNPSVCIFPFRIPEQYRQRNRFSAVIYSSWHGWTRHSARITTIIFFRMYIHDEGPIENRALCI